MYWSLSIIEQLLDFIKNVLTEIYFMTPSRNVLHSFEFTIFFSLFPSIIYSVWFSVWYLYAHLFVKAFKSPNGLVKRTVTLTFCSKSVLWNYLLNGFSKMFNWKFIFLLFETGSSFVLLLIAYKLSLIFDWLVLFDECQGKSIFISQLSALDKNIQLKYRLWFCLR
jgi:hypothetical protein